MLIAELAACMTFSIGLCCENVDRFCAGDNIQVGPADRFEGSFLRSWDVSNHQSLNLAFRDLLMCVTCLKYFFITAVKYFWTYSTGAAANGVPDDLPWWECRTGTSWCCLWCSRCFRYDFLALNITAQHLATYFLSYKHICSCRALHLAPIAHWYFNI